MPYTRRSRYSSRSPSPYHRRQYSKSLSSTPSRSRSRSRYSSCSPSPYHRRQYSKSLSHTPSRSRSRSRSRDFSHAVNPGNNLYVTGLSSQVSKAELEDHFASEGKVVDIHLVADPYTRESRGFGFVTMARIEEAERCIKYLDGSILDGRVITVEKAKRGRGRTPTPGRYLGLRKIPARHHSSRFSSSSDRERSYSPYYRRSPSPYRRSPIIRRRRYHSSLDSRSRSRSISSYCSTRSPSPSVRRRRRRKSYSRSISPAIRRSYSRSISPKQRSFRRHCPSSLSPRRCHRSPKKRDSRESYSHSRSLSSRSRSSVSRL